MKMMRSLFLSIIVSVLSSFITIVACCGQILPSRHYSVEDGLVHSNVFRMFQDSKGYMWFGTEVGLSRFDGHHFENFSHYAPFKSSQVLGFAESVDGTIWINTYDQKLHTYKDGLFREFIPEDGLIMDKSTNIYVDQKNKIWLFSEFGISSITSRVAKFEFLQVKDYLPNIDKLGRLFNSFYITKDRNILASTNSGILKLNNGKFSWEFKDVVKSNSVFAMNEDEFGNFWLGVMGSILSVSNDGKVNHYYRSFMQGKKVQHLEVDQKGRVWFAGEGLGLAVISDDKIEFLEPRLNLQKKQINDILIDSENNTWIGTFGNGVYKISELSSASYTIEHSLSNNYIQSLKEGKDGTIWIGTIGGLNTITDSVVSSVNIKLGKKAMRNSLSLSKIESLAVDSNGTVFIGVKPNHLIKIDEQGIEYGSYGWKIEKPMDTPGDSHVQLTSQSLPEKHLPAYPSFLFANRSGKMFVSFWEGLYTIHGFDLNSWEECDRLRKERIISLLHHSGGSYWIGTSSGVYELTEGRLRLHKFADSVAGNRINCIYEQQNGAIWFATQSGLAKLEAQKWLFFNTKSGLINDYCTSIVEDEQENVWIGTKGGLSCYSGEEFIQFNKERGLVSDEVQSICYDRKKHLWVGTTEGITRLNPHKVVPFDQAPPRVYISKIQSDQGIEYDPVSITLPYDSSGITLYFSSIYFTYPEGINFQYKLCDRSIDRNSDTCTDEWYTSKKWSQEYPTLAPGNYVFLVRAQADNSSWTGSPARINIEVLPPFWNTTWFRLVLTIGFVSIVYSIALYRVKKTREQEMRELDFKAQIIKLEQKALNLSVNPHFLFNALSSIQYYFNSSNSENQANIYLSKFAKLIRAILEDAYRDSQTLDEELSRLKLYLDLEKMRLGESFQWTIDIDERLDLEEVRIPTMIIQPYVENAIWHGINPLDNKGKVAVEVYLESENILRVTIVDNGIGVRQSQSTKSTTKLSHISRGMSLTKERIDLHTKTGKGCLSVKIDDVEPSEDIRVGTRVIVRIAI